MMERDTAKCEDNSQKYDKYFKKLIDNGLTPCFSIVLVKDAKIIYELAAGKESSGEESSRHMTPGTRLNIASVTKTITGALIIKLVEMGEITLSDPVKRFIPEYKFENVAIYNLLTHTAGYDETFIVEWPNNKNGRDDFFRKLYSADKLKYKTGEAAVYWSHGYAILSDIIERVTGDTLEEVARRVLFTPLSMDNSTFELSALKENEYFKPWHEREKRFFSEICIPVAIGDSGLYTTARDLVKFGQLFLDSGRFNGSEVFAKTSTDLMMREITNGRFMKTPNFWVKGNWDTYGCFGDMNSPSAIGHTGLCGCMLLIDPVYRITAAILTNSVKLHEDWKNYKMICNVLMTMNA